MRRARTGPLLAELHAHTTWSDGALTVSELVDLYGCRGFDVVCVTDHTVRPDDPWLDPTEWRDRGVRAANWAAYADEVASEASRAREQYGLLLLTGLELTYNDVDPARAAHAVAIGLHEFVSVDDGIEAAIGTARAAGAALVAAHPFDSEPTPTPARLTRRFSQDLAGLGRLVHRFELFNRSQLFGWVADAGLPAVATGDFHLPEHLAGWKTLLPCAKDEQAVVDYLRSSRPAYLVRLEDERRQPLAA
jgi:predicted metal-dependent phosphoesterase TrpH